MTEPIIVRQCGLIEHYSTSRHALGVYRGVANCCQYVVAKEKLQGCSLQTVVEEALARLVLRLGGLRVGIINENTSQASFVQVPPMNLQDFIEWKTVNVTNHAQYDEQVLAVIKNRLEQLWPNVATRPPWKLLIVENLNDSQASDSVIVDMVFATHHAISDGKSTAVFHHQLLHELNNSSGTTSQLKNHILNFHQPPVLAPTQEELIQFKISWSHFLKTLWDEFGPSWLKPTPPAEPWRGKAITLEPHTFCLRLMSIRPEVVSSLVSASRAHSATLTAILHALVLAPLVKRVPADVASVFSCETPIGLLPWAKLPPGVDIDLSKVLTDLNTGIKYVWDAETVSKLRSEFNNSKGEDGAEIIIWSLAAAWRAHMKAKVASLPNDDTVGMLAWVSNWQERWLGKVGKPRDNTWTISNIGSMKGVRAEGFGGWRIQRVFFTQPAFVVGPAFGVNVTGVEGGEVTLALNWQEIVIDATVVDGVMEDLGAWVEEFGKTGRFGIFTSAQ